MTTTKTNKAKDRVLTTAELATMCKTTQHDLRRVLRTKHFAKQLARSKNKHYTIRASDSIVKELVAKFKAKADSPVVDKLALSGVN